MVNRTRVEGGGYIMHDIITSVEVLHKIPNTRYYVTQKSLSPSMGKKKVPPCPEMQGQFVN